MTRNHIEPRNRIDDEGAATALILALVLLAALAATALAGLVIAATARNRAQTAADLAALAGAQVVLDAARGGPLVEPCAAAQQTVLRNQATMSQCTASAGVVQVSTSVTTTFGAATAVARAGPPADHATGSPGGHPGE